MNDLKSGFLGILLLILSVLLFFGILNYFNIISLSTLYPNLFGSLPHQQLKESQTQKIPTPVLTLKCPVPQELCNSAEKIIYKGNPALGYKLPDQTSITSIAPVVDSLRFFELPYKETNPKGLYQSYIDRDSCYSVTYTFPYDADLKKIDLLPLIQGTQIATSGPTKNGLTIQNNLYQLIVQIQKRALGRGQYDFQKCSVKTVEPKSFGTYEKIDKNTFK